MFEIWESKNAHELAIRILVRIFFFFKKAYLNKSIFYVFVCKKETKLFWYKFDRG